jgi:hypothetical protein
MEALRPTRQFLIGACYFRYVPNLKTAFHKVLVGNVHGISEEDLEGAR